MSIGDNIRAARTDRNLTQVQLANLLGCTDSTLRKYESDSRKPKFDTIQKIAAVMGLTAAELINYDVPRDMKLAINKFENTLKPYYILAEKKDKEINKANGYDPKAMQDKVPDYSVNRFDVYAKTCNAIDKLAEELDEYLK